MSPADLFPGLAPWVQSLPNLWPAYVIKPQFATWEVLHILSLIILGGTSILLNLRLIGFGMVDETPSEIQRALRPWIHVGVVGIVASGLLIGMANAERLYNSAAFTVKLIALLSGVILTYGASAPTAKADGEVSPAAKAWWLVGLVVFLVGVLVLVTSKLINPGVFHVLTAAALIVLFVTVGRTKWIYLAGLLALIAAQWIGTHVVVKQTDFARLDPTNKAFAVVFAAWILGFAAVQLFAKGGGPEARPLAKAIGYLSILAWVLAAAAGRWIAFA